jgi:RNA polymerase sigma-70 factor (ECF subfamily)
VSFAAGPDQSECRISVNMGLDAGQVPKGEVMSAATGTDVGSAEFARLAGPLRADLLAHCYRMLGSVHDAEDQVQETMLRAWRGYGEFEGRSSLRTWLYRIATNACLRAIENRARRPLPSGLADPSQDAAGPLASPAPEALWLQPIPDRLLQDDPATVVAGREDVRLAFIAALQYLPGRQRAVLILRDVLGWRAAEVAELLGTSTVAVNSALQRARARLAQVSPRRDEPAELPDPRSRALLDRYAAAFEQADVDAMLDLLTSDATFEMPPVPTWFAGREVIAAFLRARVLREPGAFRMVAAAANGQPGFAAYLRDRDGVHRAHGIQVLTVRNGRIAAVVSVHEPSLFAPFGLPPEL